jgi:hypothetical protein
MKLALGRILLLGGLLAVPLCAQTFLDQLDAEQRKRLGLDQLTPAQLAELGQAVESYRKTGEVAAAKQAAEAAVAEYKRQEEPGVVSRALEIFKRKEEVDRGERITAVLLDRFDGWSGRTTFRLDNGQVWRQSLPGNYYTKPREQVAVVIYKSSSGYFRLRVLDDEGAWVTVKRVE